MWNCGQFVAMVVSHLGLFLHLFSENPREIDVYNSIGVRVLVRFVTFSVVIVLLMYS